MYWQNFGFCFHSVQFSFSRRGIPDTQVNRKATNIGEITLNSSHLCRNILQFLCAMMNDLDTAHYPPTSVNVDVAEINRPIQSSISPR